MNRHSSTRAFARHQAFTHLSCAFESLAHACHITLHHRTLTIQPLNPQPAALQHSSILMTIIYIYIYISGSDGNNVSSVACSDVVLLGTCCTQPAELLHHRQGLVRSAHAH